MPENAAKEIQFCERWLKDGIGEGYQNWLPYIGENHRKASRIFIESPTGTGKSSFVLDILFRFAAENKRNVLYLTNRSALGQQVRNAAARKWQQKGRAEENEVSFRYPNTSYWIKILNYQAIPLNCDDLYDLLSKYSYIVFDEAHFFIEDALFNAKTGLILRNILNAARNLACIFLSATMDESEALLQAMTTRLQPYNGIDPVLNGITMKEHCVVYRNTYRNAVYTPVFFKNYNELLPAIRQTEGEKWLIFAHSIHKGEAMQQSIKRETGRKAMFLSSKNKSGKNWEEIATEERFEQDILITTKVLDNGVNIRDEGVKHVVIPFCDRTEFMQMLGRRRTEIGETFCVYIQVPKIQEINTLKHNIGIKLKNIYDVRNCPGWKRNVLLGEMWERGDKSINCLFFVDVRSGWLCANDLAEIKLEQLKFFYKDLAAHYKEGDYYEKLVLQWIGMGDSKPRYLGQTTENGLPDFLVCHAGVRMLQSEWEPFYQEFERLYEQECRERFPSESEIFQKAFSVRKAPSRRKSTINQQLRLLGLPYELKKEINCWILCKK